LIIPSITTFDGPIPKERIMTLALPYFGFDAFTTWTRARLFPVRRSAPVRKAVVNQEAAESLPAPAFQGQWQVLRYL